VSADGVSDAFADADAETGAVEIGGGRVDHQHRVGGLALPLEHAGEVPA
jgi:hypothetical protein